VQTRLGIPVTNESRHGPGKRVAMLERKYTDGMTQGALLLSVITLCGCEDLVVNDTASLLLPSFQRSEIIGIVAGFGTTFAAVPDLIKMFKRRSSKGINPTMAGIMCVFQILWVYYGLLIASRPVIAWNLIAVVINSITVGAYFLFARRERNKEE
jgi:MtN3 and saliva related transmembrane protein